KEEAMRIFAEKNKAINLSDLNMDNPLPNSYVLRVDKPQDIEAAAMAARALPGVQQGRYGQEVLDRYIKVLLILAAVCLVTIGLLVLFTYSSINNIIALSIYARRAEIRI